MTAVTASKPVINKPKRKKKLRPVILFCTIIGLFMCAITLFPVIWALLGSFKQPREVYKANPVIFFPTRWYWDNYIELFANKDAPYFNSMLITGAVAVFGALVSITFSSMAAYAFSRLEFPRKNLLWLVVMFNMFIPSIAVLITSYKVCADLGMMNTFWVLTLPGIANGGQTFFFRQFFLQMPRSLEEAAKVDGANRFMIYQKIILPNAKGAIVLQGVGSFLGWWNSYLWPSMTVTNPKLRQVSQVIRSYSSTYVQKFGVVLAGTFLAALVPFIVFAIYQRYLVQNMIISGIK